MVANVLAAAAPLPAPPLLMAMVMRLVPLAQALNVLAPLLAPARERTNVAAAAAVKVEKKQKERTGYS